jgi:hypothetical protein
MGSSGQDVILPGIDFTKSYAPIINDISLRIVLIGMMIWNLNAKIIKIKTGFLHDDLEERIFMETPSGMEVDDSKCLVLKNTDLCRVLDNFMSKLSKH